ncbi:MAG: hypothetical protein HY318_08045 [Armatimonadetes bacterium]|nr:hypothetical protein [Armatimonadota bacterium]
MALDRRQPDRTPFGFGFGLQPPARREFDAFLERRGLTFEEVERRCADLRSIYPDYVGPELRTFPDGSVEDIWGTRRKPQSYGIGEYQEMSWYPLAEAKSPADLDGIRWPSADWWDFDNFAAKLKAENPEGRWAVRSGRGNLLETATWMTGMEKIFIDLAENPELIDETLRRITDIYLEFNTRLLEAANGEVDVVFTADDLGGQKGLLLSRRMFRERVMPHHARLNERLHDFDVKIMFHTDGAVMDIIPELIEMGIDALEALQFDADGMDPQLMKERFGDRLAFHGGISVQHTLPFGTPDQVREHVRYLDGTLGRGGGYILAPAHAIQAGTPPENVWAMLEQATGLDLAG